MEKRVFIGGDDFKSGQTKIKSVLVDFLVSAGIKVRRNNQGINTVLRNVSEVNGYKKILIYENRYCFLCVQFAALL